MNRYPALNLCQPPLQDGPQPNRRRVQARPPTGGATDGDAWAQVRQGDPTRGCPTTNTHALSDQDPETDGLITDGSTATHHHRPAAYPIRDEGKEIGKLTNRH